MKTTTLILIALFFTAVFSGCKKDETVPVKKDPIITWANPADISYGTLLSVTQLNATADVPGSFVYTPALDVKLDIGDNQDLKVDFTPTDGAKYNVVTKTVKINVTNPVGTADASKGGIMYDSFWSTEAGYDQGSANLATYIAAADFFRCKQCHAWDGLGIAGSYIGRAPRAFDIANSNQGRPNVSALGLYQMAQTKTVQELFDGMKKTDGRRDIAYDLLTYDPITNATDGDKMPNYTQLLTDAQIWDIVKFMKEGMFDVSQLYDAIYTGVYPTGSAAYSNIGKDGDETSGNTYYTTNCAVCHGVTGTSIAMEGMSLGKFLRSKPNEVQHKTKYGTLGTSMVGEFDIILSQMKDLYKALANTTNFPD